MPSTQFTAQQAGTIRNHLGILTTDKKKILPERLLSLTGTNPTQMSAVTGISRPQLYKKEIPVMPSNSFVKRILDVVVVTDLAYELFNKNAKETGAWLTTPNSLLFGDSPFEVCMSGQAGALKKWLLERLGQEPIVT